ncbi:MAG: hypothetical protein H6733_17405 [Alphaproteobacteria bacterium]|nr:hypothetical protein [Alphaproteobacteria bacterium]
MRALHALFPLLFVVACGGGVDIIGDGDTDTTPSVDASVTAGVQCPNALQPARSLVCDDATPVCCLGGQLGLKPECVDSLEACGSSSRFECDDATDCGTGSACCMSETSGGSGGSTYVAQCKEQCSLFQKQLCRGPGTCKSAAQTCCIDEGDAWGVCVGANAECPEDTSGGT